VPPPVTSAIRPASIPSAKTSERDMAAGIVPRPPDQQCDYRRARMALFRMLSDGRALPSEPMNAESHVSLLDELSQW